MNILGRKQLTTLITHEADVCVSMFMPTHRSGRAQQQDPIRLKNLVSEAREKLGAYGLTEAHADELLRPIESLRGDDVFWAHREDGLAVFVAPGFFRWYRLPLILETDVRVNARFCIGPLIPLLNGNSRFFVLALSQDNAQLFEATRYRIRELDLDAALATVKQAAAIHEQEHSLQFRTLGAVTAGKGPALFHGHGGASDVSKQDVLKYFQAIDRAVSKLLRGEGAPLVLACVGYLASIYESANSYSRLISGKVPGNPDIWTEEELRDRAWELAAPILNQRRDQALERFDKEFGTDKVVTDTRKVVLAANEGRVETLFLEKDRQVWGNIDRNLGAVYVRDAGEKDGEELLEFAAAQTLIHGGRVYSLDCGRSPARESPAAALLRYSA